MTTRLRLRTVSVSYKRKLGLPDYGGVEVFAHVSADFDLPLELGENGEYREASMSLEEVHDTVLDATAPLWEAVRAEVSAQLQPIVDALKGRTATTKTTQTVMGRPVNN